MTSRRRLPALAASGLALLVLTACEAPSPSVTVVAGTNTVRNEAALFCFEGQSLADDTCRSEDTQLKQLKVRPGQQVGVDVDKDIAERGWYLELAPAGGQGQEAQRSEMQDEHYFTFTAPDLGGEQGQLLLTVRSVAEGGDPQDVTGEWAFLLVADDS